MKWFEERDQFVAHTLQFVQSIAGTPSDKPRADVEPLRQTATPAPPPLPRAFEPLPKVDLRAEILARVALFKAQQKRGEDMRDRYFNETMARVRASLGH